MRVVIAPDKFKRSLEAAQVADAIDRGLRRARPDLQTTIVPMADGGEGT
ncbi:MAG: glycerate kinase, partial [Vulcanimicrobiaceae bacterium]